MCVCVCLNVCTLYTQVRTCYLGTRTAIKVSPADNRAMGPMPPHRQYATISSLFPCGEHMCDAIRPRRAVPFCAIAAWLQIVPRHIRWGTNAWWPVRLVVVTNQRCVWVFLVIPNFVVLFAQSPMCGLLLCVCVCLFTHAGILTSWSSRRGARVRFEIALAMQSGERTVVFLAALKTFRPTRN